MMDFRSNLQSECAKFPYAISQEIRTLRQNVLKLNLIDINELCDAEFKHYLNWKRQTDAIQFSTSIQNQEQQQQQTSIGQAKQMENHHSSNGQRNDSGKNRFGMFTLLSICAMFCLTVSLMLLNLNALFEYFTSIRCFVPNNYMIWEATRPISDCQFCVGVNHPLILSNVSQTEFEQFAYSSQPIIIKNAVTHWPARNQLTFQFLKDLYYSHPSSLANFNDECQFLPFKSTFSNLEEFLDMPTEQVQSGQPTWYVGFSNCQANILAELRTLYPRPHFLPSDAEIPNTDYTFLGYNEGAVMHLDYIPRLMWQAQLQGNKTWTVSPTPECDTKCSSFSFYVEPGDAVLIDTRIWYHGTSVAAGQFSMTIQSEYG